MPTDDDGPSPLGELLKALTECVDEASEKQPEGWVTVEKFRIAMPVEFYVRGDPSGTGGVAAVESGLPSRTLTSMMPVLHQLTLVVEVTGAGEREPGMES